MSVVRKALTIKPIIKLFYTNTRRSRRTRRRPRRGSGAARRSLHSTIVSPRNPTSNAALRWNLTIRWHLLLSIAFLNHPVLFAGCKKQSHNMSAKNQGSKGKGKENFCQYVWQICGNWQEKGGGWEEEERKTWCDEPYWRMGRVSSWGSEPHALYFELKLFYVAEVMRTE